MPSENKYVVWGKVQVLLATESSVYRKYGQRLSFIYCSSLVTQTYTPLHSRGTCHSWKGYITVLLVDIFQYFWRIYTCTTGVYLPLLLMLTYTNIYCIRVPVSLVDNWLVACTSNGCVPVLLIYICLYLWWIYTLLPDVCQCLWWIYTCTYF